MADIKCMQNIDTENVHEGHYLPVFEQKQKHKHIVLNTTPPRNQVQVQVQVLCIFTNQVLKYIKY